MPKQRTKTSATKVPLWTKDFILITACNLLIFLAFQMIPASLPVYLTGLNVSNSMIGIAVASTTLLSVIFRPFVGYGNDRHGRRPYFVIGMVGLALTIGSLGLIPSIFFVVTVRICQGVTWAAANTSASTIAADTVPRSRFGEGIGFFSLASGIAMAVSPAASLFMFDTLKFSYQTIVLVSAGLIALAFLLSFFLRYKKAPERTTETTQEQNPQEASTKTPGRFSFANLFEKAALLPSMVMFFNNAAAYTVITYVRLHAEAQGIDNVPLYFVIYAIFLLFSRPAVGKLVDEGGYKIPIIVGLLCTTTATILIASSGGLLQLLIGGALFGFGQGGVIAALQTMAVADSPFERRGAATSTFFTGFEGGSGLGVIFSGITAGIFGYANMFYIITAAPIIALIIYIIFGRNRENPSAKGKMMVHSAEELSTAETAAEATETVTTSLE